MSEILFAFRIGGRDINPDEISDRETLAKIEDIVGSIMEAVEGLSCPLHGEAPRFLCSGEDFDKISVETHGCCKGLISEVKKRMNV